MDERDPLTYAIIGAAIAVSKQLGAGLLESVYEKCLVLELRERGFQVVHQQSFPVEYHRARVAAASSPT